MLIIRTYEGIFDNRVSVHEKQLAWLSRLPIETVQDQLQQLRSFGMVSNTCHFAKRYTSNTLLIKSVIFSMAQYLQINQDQYLFAAKNNMH